MSPPSGGAAGSAAPASPAPAVGETWDVTKHSWWRGAYSRRLSLINGWLLTSDPATGRTTNAWRLADVAQVVRQQGAALEVRFAGCAAGCGPLAPALRLSLASAPMAAALHANLSCTVLRHMKAEVHAANFELVASILDARPCELLPANARSVAQSPAITPVRASPIGSPRASPPPSMLQPPGEGGVRAVSSSAESSHDAGNLAGSSSRHRPTPGLSPPPPLPPPPPPASRELIAPHMQPLAFRSSGTRSASRDDDAAASMCSEDLSQHSRARDPELTFEVQITVQKARKLRPPPALSGAPRVAVSWGVPPLAPRPPSLPATVPGPADASRATSSLGSRDFGAVVGGLWSAALTSSFGGLPTAEPALRDSSAADASTRRPVCFETPPGEDDPASPRWNSGASFEYSATLAQLASTVLRLELDYVRLLPLRPSHIGACEVMLSDIASGPIKYDLPVLDAAGMPCGRLVFTVRMIQKCVLAVTLPWARATMRSLQRHTSEASQKASHRDADFTLTVALTMEADECEPMRVEFDSSSLHLLDGAQVQVQYNEAPNAPRPAIEAEASASAFANESLHLEVLLSNRNATGTPVRSPSLDSLSSSGSASSFGSAGARGRRDRQERLRGEVWLPMTKVYTPADKRHATTEFDEVLWKNGQRVGRLSGCVVVHHGPRVVQLPGGFFTEHGIVPVGPVAFDSSTQRAPGRADSPSHARISAFLGGDSPGASRPPMGADGESPAPSPSRGGARGEMPLFRPPPKGTCLPKQIEALVALVHGLKQVILELHTTRADEPSFSSVSDESPDSPPTPVEHPLPPAVDQEEQDDFEDHPDTPAQPRGSAAQGASGGGAAALAARRLNMLCQRMQVLLSSSHKESVRSFFYPSAEGLAYTQLLLIRLWAHLLKQVDHLPHRHQGCLFATLTPLTLRGELSPSALLSAPTQLLEKYAHVLWATVGYVTSKLNRKAATSEVRTFCSHALAIAFFRLPRLRPTLLAIILPPGENRFKHVREWNLPWSLHKAALKDGRGDTYATATEPKPASLPPQRVSAHGDPEGSGGTPRRSISPLTAARFNMHGAPASAVVSDPLDAWAVLWMSQGLAQAVPQPEVDRNLSVKYWRERLRKRGHCFFLFLEHWARHASVAVGTQPDECTNWRMVPGYAVLVKAFLLEMRQRPVTLWPESMRSCMAALVVENRSLTQVFARILVSAASGTSLRRTLIALQRLSELMTLATDEASAAAQQQSNNFIHATPSAPALYGATFGAGFGGSTAGGAFGGGGFGGGAVGGRDTAEAHSYDLVLHQIKYLLASQHFKVVGCALIFLYNHLDRLGDERRLQVLGWIHDSMFGTLALHWSRVVRSSFMHIVVLKVQHSSDPPTVQPFKRRIIERAASLEREGASAAAADLLAPSSGRRGIGASNSVPSGLHLGLNEPDELSENGRRAIPTSHSMIGRSDSILSSSSATKLSKLALYDAEASLLQAAFEESLRLVQALAESKDGSTVAVEAAEQLGLGVAGEAATASDRLATWQSYARHAWAEHNSLQHKWEEMREMQSRYPDAPADDGGRRANGHTHHAGHGPSHAQNAPQRRQLTLSMAGLCESSDEDDEEGSSDEW